MKTLIYILTFIISCILTTSCERGGRYYYIVSNNSSQEIHLILYPDEKDIKDDLYCQCYNHIYWNNNGYWYDVRYLENETKEMDSPLLSINLKCGESIKFTLYDPSEYITENPEIPNTYAIWLRQNCLNQILIVEDSEIKSSELSYDYWSKSSNWIIQNESQYSIEYWLVIDDEVIREYGISDNQDH